jgi:hypothetical protein
MLQYPIKPTVSPMGGDHDPGIDSFVNIQKFPYFSG